MNSTPQTLQRQRSDSALRYPLHLDLPTLRTLLTLQGPSLGLWRAAEVAALRTQTYEPPVLDLGCGDGLVTSLVLSQVAIALDPDPNALASATARGIYAQPLAVAVEQADIAAASIGTVISNSVLEHLPHLDQALSAIARMLKPGGQLVFTVPTEAFSHWLALPTTQYACWRNRHLCHLNLWSVEQWTRQLEQVGLTVEVVKPYLRRELVSIWDGLELLQQVRIGRRRLFGRLWQQLPQSWIDTLAESAAQLDLSAPPPGGGCLIVARKPGV